MAAKITLITPPDDIFDDALRVLLVDLTQEQSQLVSDALNSTDISTDLIAYVWNHTNTIEWLIDKKHKSHLIIFNADSDNAELNGYLAAHSNSYYMGTLRSIGITTKRAIKDQSQCSEILNHFIVEYDKR